MFWQKKIEPGPGQESVWDYPRPPRLEDTDKHIQVILNGLVIAETTRAKRILETSHPPVYYLPPDDLKMEYFVPTTRNTYCEWKGQASYYTLKVGEVSRPNAAWYYARPTPEYAGLKNYVAIYPGQVDACYVNGEKVTPQPGDFYGGWITSDVTGPFKEG